MFNALDNLDARRHVNKMCLAADVPLIESGTTGFNGQVQPIKKGVTQCYDCTPKETPKSFPVCTIRSTPSQAIHCIVWAKSYLFTELFGVSEDAAAEVDGTEDADNSAEIENLRREASALKDIRQAMGTSDFAKKVFDKVYDQDIKRLCSMDDMWKTRKPPTSLDYDAQIADVTSVASNIQEQDQKTWTLPENVAVFVSSLSRLSDRLELLKKSTDGVDTPPVLTFDKDDKDTLDFVTAAANLRSIVFGIETKSEFDIKQMAGNIIPAIATTNATTAALCVLQAFKVMQGTMDKAKMVFLAKSTERVIDREDLRAPNPDCAVCGNVTVQMVVNTALVTLADVVNDLLKTQLGYTDEMSISTETGLIFDPEYDDNLPKTLQELGITKDAFFTVIDQEDLDTKVNLVLYVGESAESGITTRPTLTLMPKKPVKVAATDDLNDDVQSTKAAPDSATRKRSASDAPAGAEVLVKRGKLAGHANGAGKDAIVLDDEEGAIVLD